MKWTSWVTLAALVVIVALVVVSSLRTGGVRCEACVEFGGRSACREVDAEAEAEARSGAVTNACALVASGVTDTIACQRTGVRRLECRPD